MRGLFQPRGTSATSPDPSFPISRIIGCTCTQGDPLGFMGIAFSLLSFLVSGITGCVGYLKIHEPLCTFDISASQNLFHWRHLHLILSELGWVGEHVPREEGTVLCPSRLGEVFRHCLLRSRPDTQTPGEHGGSLSSDLQLHKLHSVQTR